MFARFLLVTCCLGAPICGWVRSAIADRPDPSFRCTYGPDGKCIPKSREYGYYPTHWRRWPGNTEMAWEEPKAAPQKPASRKQPAEQSETEEPSTGKSSTEGAPGKKVPVPVPDETSLEPELPPKTRPAMPDEDQPPRPPAAELPPALPTLPAPELPPPPSMEKSPPAAPKQPEPALAPPTPPPAMQGELPQPSVDQDLRNLLPEEKKPPKKGPLKSPRKSSDPPVPPPQLREDPFRDDPLPSEAPATPKSSKQTPGAAPADAGRLTRTGASQMQWRPGGPAATPTLRPAAADLKLLPETGTLEAVEAGPTNRQTSFDSGADEPLNPLRKMPHRAAPPAEPQEVVPTANWGIATPAILISGPGPTQNPLR